MLAGVSRLLRQQEHQQRLLDMDRSGLPYAFQVRGGQLFRKAP